MEPSKVIISTDLEYSKNHENILAELFNRKIELFCACGKHCESWEEAMDLYITDPIRMDSNHHITTTSHPDESFDEVLNFAEVWPTNNGNSTVEVLKL